MTSIEVERINAFRVRLWSQCPDCQAWCYVTQAWATRPTGPVRAAFGCRDCGEVHEHSFDLDEAEIPEKQEKAGWYGFRPHSKWGAGE